MRLMVILIGLLGFTIGTSSCESKSKKKDIKTEVKEQGKEYTSAFICPMHCDGSGSMHAGKCPVCGMDYVKNPDIKEHHHDHNHDHNDAHEHNDHNKEGHNHDHGDGHDHDH